MIVHRISDDAGHTLIALQGDLFALRQAPLTAANEEGRHVVALELAHRGVAEARRQDFEMLAAVLANAERHARDPLSGDWYWYERHELDEAPKRALVYGGSVAADGGAWHRGSVQTGRNVGVVDCVIEHGAWESVEPVVITLSGSNLTTLPPLGELPGRIAKFDAADATAAAVTALLAGIRERGYGTTQAASVMAPGTLALFSSPNVEQTLKTTDLATAITSTDYRHVQGRYLAIGEVGGGVSDIVEASIRIAVGSAGASAGAPAAYHTGGWTVSDIVKLGTIEIPPAGAGAGLTSAQIGDVALYVYGTCYDPVVFGANSRITPFEVHLVPADHYALWIDLAQANTITDLRLVTLPNGDAFLHDNTASQYTAVAAEVVNWSYPPEGGYLYATVYETTTLNELKPAVGTLTVYPRWSGYRSRYA